jgi:hypothetical protein
VRGPNTPTETTTANIARARCFPALFAEQDKDGLIPARLLEPIQPGVYRQGPLVVFAHPFFRRSLSRLNNLNIDLLNELERLAPKSDVLVKVRLDGDAVGLADQCREPIEMQYWRGPKFTDDLASVQPGVTQHGADDRQRLFSLVCRTEFWWQSRRNGTLKRQEHIFEAEELREHYTFGSDELLYGCRYVHSIISESAKVIEHLDGAIREYTDEELLERIEKDIARAGRHTKYTKYWRADGPLSLSVWKTMVYHHFRDNPLAGEYLGMTPQESGDDIAPPPPTALSRAVPHAGAMAGVRAVLSYPRFEEALLETDRCLAKLGFVRDGEQETRFVDAEFIDFLKLSGRAGLCIALPDDVELLAFEEHYHVFPLIRHRTHAAADETLNILRSFVSLWQNPERVLSFSLSVITGDLEVRLSLLGGCAQLAGWLQRFTFPPQTINERIEWVDKVSGYLNSLPPVNDEPSLGRVIKADGIFFLPRARIPREWIDSANPDGTLNLRLERINEADSDLAELAVAGKIAGTFSGFIFHSTCSRCGSVYRICPCSKYADNDVSERVEKFQLVSRYWTDRPA